MAGARSKYDVIVLDTAPLLAVPDTRVIAPHADNVCLVIRAEYVPKGAALRVLRAGRTPLAGVVLNAFRERRSLIDFNDSYGYYKYGSSGNAYGDGREAYGAKES
jgi:succinoglycan biosynthesis transport protein ExoP